MITIPTTLRGLARRLLVPDLELDLAVAQCDLAKAYKQINHDRDFFLGLDELADRCGFPDVPLLYDRIEAAGKDMLAAHRALNLVVAGDCDRSLSTRVGMLVAHFGRQLGLLVEENRLLKRERDEARAASERRGKYASWWMLATNTSEQRRLKYREAARRLRAAYGELAKDRDRVISNLADRLDDAIDKAYTEIWRAQALEQRLSVCLAPRPWRVERDWTFEVTAANGTIVHKASSPEEAEAICDVANEDYERAEKAEAEAAKLRADYLRIAEACGRVYEADYRPRVPADVDTVLERIASLTEREDEATGLRVRAVTAERRVAGLDREVIDAKNTLYVDLDLYHEPMPSLFDLVTKAIGRMTDAELRVAELEAERARNRDECDVANKHANDLHAKLKVSMAEADGLRAELDKHGDACPGLEWHDDVTGEIQDVLDEFGLEHDDECGPLYDKIADSVRWLGRALREAERERDAHAKSIGWLLNNAESNRTSYRAMSAARDQAVSETAALRAELRDVWDALHDAGVETSNPEPLRDASITPGASVRGLAKERAELRMLRDGDRCEIAAQSEEDASMLREWQSRRRIVGDQSNVWSALARATITVRKPGEADAVTARGRRWTAADIDAMVELAYRDGFTGPNCLGCGAHNFGLHGSPCVHCGFMAPGEQREGDPVGLFGCKRDEGEVKS